MWKLSDMNFSKKDNYLFLEKKCISLQLKKK